MSIFAHKPRGTVFYVGCVLIALTIGLSLKAGKSPVLSANAANPIGIYCSPQPNNGEIALTTQLHWENNNNFLYSVKHRQTIHPPSTGMNKLVIHALGKSTNECQTYNCTVPGPGNNCAPGACVVNPNGLYQPGVSVMYSKYTAHGESPALNQGSPWTFGISNAVGSPYHHPILDTHDLQKSTGPMGGGLSVRGVYEIRVKGDTNGPTLCNFPTTLPEVNYTVTIDPEVNNGCRDCKTQVGGPVTSVGEPVSVLNGNMYLDQQDYGLESLGEGLRLVRAYNSLNLAFGMFGQGWTTNLEARLDLYTTKFIRLKWGDGGATYFELQSNGKYLPWVRRDWFIELVKETDGTYTLLQKGGGKYRFSNMGRLTAMLDKNGNATALTRDANNRVTTVTDAVGNTLTFTYNSTAADARVTAVADGGGTVATYTYFAGTLASVTYQDGSKYQFSHIAVGSTFVLATVKDAMNNILETHAYDSLRRATTSELHGGVEKYTLNYVSHTSTEVTDALGRKTVYTLDKERALWAVTQIEGQCACGAGGNEAQKFTYNDYGEVLKHTNALNEDTLFTYDNFGNRLTVTNPLGLTSFTYDDLGQVVTTTDTMGGTTTNTFDGNGNLLQQQDASGVIVKFGAPNAQGLPPTYTDSRNNVTNLTYDAQGRLWKLTDPNGKITTLEYWPRGWQKSVTTPLGFKTSFTYDQVGRLKTTTDPANYVTTNFYDLAGRLTKVTDAKLKDTIYTYDQAYRLLSVKDALNRTVSYG
ncbi:MAG: RHS repeat protein, partial [Acidobacteria bacterium]|nr:RHS repeat protein [Acidobacteriota bacterium]